MKILFVFTGGTIGSTAQGDFIGTDHKKPYLLLERYREVYGMDFAFDTVAPYTNLSENSTGKNLTLLMESVAAAANGYDGIVVTHGTDTLQYSAAALSYALADIQIPVLLVSSNKTIDDPTANGLANLRAAIRFIAEVKAPGVFVPYRNEGEAVTVHRGTRLCESLPFSDAVYSICNSYYGTFLDEAQPFAKNPLYCELANETAALGAQCLQGECEEILRVAPYPGNPYRPLPADVRYILHTSYHSGTVNTESAVAKAFFAAAKAAGIPVFLTGVEPGAAYDSTRLFAELGIEPLCNIAPIAAFVKLWMLTAKYKDTPITQKMLQQSLGGDVVAPLA